MAGQTAGEVDPTVWGIYASAPNDATIAARVPQRVRDTWMADLAEVAAVAGCSKGAAAAVGVQILNDLKEQWIASARRITTRSAGPGEPPHPAVAEAH
jgi:hypothetical protein